MTPEQSFVWFCVTAAVALFMIYFGVMDDDQ